MASRRVHRAPCSGGPALAFLRRVLAAALPLLLGAAIALSDEPPGGVRRWRVLLLQDSDPFLSDSLRVDQAFRAALIEGSDRPIDFIREWSGGDRSRYFDSDAERVAFLRGKYRRFSIDLIVSMDETGFEFVRRHRGEVWPSAPLVFCGISDTDARARPRPARSAGIVLADDVAGTVELALALQPAARRLVVVDGTADPDSGIGARLREALVKARRRLDVSFLAAEPVPTLLTALRRVPAGSIVLYALSDRDSSTLSQRTRDIVKRISEVSAAPVYSLRETSLGQGVVGGVSSSVEEHGRDAAALALRLLAGQNPEPLALGVTTPIPRADWLQLRRWGMDETRLPADADLRNVRQKLWQSHRREVILAAIAFAGLTAVILALLLWRADRRVAEDQLQRRLAFEHLISEVSASVTDVSVDTIHDDVERALARVADAMRLERCALFVVRPGQSRASISHVAYARASQRSELLFGGEVLARLADALREGTAVELDEALGTRRPGFPSDPAEGDVILVPVSIADGAVSGILFRSTQGSRALPADMVSRMLLVGQILLSAVTRRGAEVSLRTSEERYRTVVESQSDLICRYLPDTTLTFVNDAYCRYFASKREDLIGRRFLELVPERSREHVRRHVQSLLQNPRAELDEQETLRPDGSVGWIQWSDYAIFGRDGRIVEFQGIGRDITDRKRAQEAEGRLAHAARLTVLGELATSIAHEIRQPLGAILSNAEAAELLLESGLKDEGQVREIRTILSDIHREDLRASSVIQHVRSLMQHRAPQMERLDANDVVRDIVQFVGPDARRRRIRIELDLGEHLPVISGDPIQLQQVLLNLVINGMDAMAATPEPLRRVRIRTLSKGSHVVLEVRDAGQGIPAEVFPRLFQSFVTTRRDGLGLGLSLSRSIVEAHGGRITAGNNPSRGATFRCILPATADKAATDQSQGRIA